MDRTKLWLAVMVVFLSGLIIGGLGGMTLAKYHIKQMIRQGPKEMHHMVLRYLNRELDLSEEQKRAVKKVMAGVQKSAVELQKQYRPQMKKMMDTALDEIRPLLTPEQQTKLDRIKAEGLMPKHREDRPRKRFGNRPPGRKPGPPPRI